MVRLRLLEGRTGHFKVEVIEAVHVESVRDIFSFSSGSSGSLSPTNHVVRRLNEPLTQGGNHFKQAFLCPFMKSLADDLIT